jgi:threonine-phosphate decarboxylase
MNSAAELARKNVKGLETCVHGGEVWEVAHEKGLSIRDLVDFSSSINPLGPSPRALEAMKNSFEQLSLYPDSDATALREAIASHFGGINKRNVVVGNGSTELIYLFAQIFLKKGDLAVIPAPTFGEYANVAVRNRSKLKHVRMSRDFQLEPDVFKLEMKGAKSVFLCNPNNPTSMLIPHEAVVEILEEALRKDVVVFLDEDFIEFVNDENRNSFVKVINKYPNLFILRTFTKFYGLTGLRVGYGIGDEETIEVFSKVKMPWNVNSLAQTAAIAALADKDHSRRTMETVRIERQFLIRELSQIIGFKVFPAESNFIFLDVRESNFTAAQLKEMMLTQGILVRDCSSFAGLDAYYVRLAVRTRQENERLLNGLRKVLNLAC